jgi:8-oxo-dGTP diphosphatase
MTPNKFNIRVYGILIQNQQVLITDEVIRGNRMTKFPGGGLEFGEGLSECLIREFDEELDIEIKVGKLFYINDFFKESAFNPSDQLISIYYLVEQTDGKKIPIAKKPFDFTPPINQCFRWLKLSAIRTADFTYPIDQKVCELLNKMEL